jgi:hypothetical protein
MSSPPIIDEYRRLLGLILADAEHDHLQLGGGGEQNAPPIAVYLTILQSANEAALLLQQPTITTGGILRGILESYADLCALVIAPDYAARMLATFYEEKCKLYRDMLRDPTNIYHADVAQHHDPQVNLDECQKLIDNLKAKGHQPLKNFQRMEAAGLQQEYRSIYWQLCLESHNNISAIEARHVEKIGNIIHFDLRRPNQPGELLKYFDTLTSIVIDSTKKIHELTRSPAVARWLTWGDRLVAFRQSHLPPSTGSPATSAAP